MTDNQKEKHFMIVFMFTKAFFSAVSFLNDLMKILVGIDIFNHVIFKDLGSDCYGKNFISQLADHYLQA